MTDDTAWTEIGKALPPLKPEATPAERDRAIAHYERVIRPVLAPTLVVEPTETPEEKLERLRRTIWDKPVIIGRGLASKVPGWLERLEAEERRREIRKREGEAP